MSLAIVGTAVMMFIRGHFGTWPIGPYQKDPTPSFLISTLIWPIASGKPKIGSLLPAAHATSSVGRV